MLFFKIKNLSDRAGSTFVQLDMVTRVVEIKSRENPSTLHVYFTDRSQPETITDQNDVQAILAYMESKSVNSAQLADKINRETPKKA